MRLLPLVFLLCLASTARSEKLAEDASESLLRAATLLEQSESAGDRIGALTETIRAYELGLQAMRGQVRRLTLKQRDLQNELASEDEDVSALLAMMQNATQQTQAQTILHPGSAPETIRAGTLARAVVPSLMERASLLQTRLTELDDTERLLLASKGQLEQGLSQVRDARRALADALTTRQELPPRLATDEAAIAALIDGSETLSALADSLQTGEGGEGLLNTQPWSMPVQVALNVDRHFDNDTKPDRPGWDIATNSNALITAPTDSTIRFSGKIPDFGHVVILEGDGGHLITLSGMNAGHVVRDQVVALGEPIGFMGDTQDKLNASDGQSSLNINETLYIEIRRGGAPVDPALLLTAGQE